MAYCTYIEVTGQSGYNLLKNIVFFCLKIFFTLSTNSVDPDEMQNNAAFHLSSLFAKVLILVVSRIQRVNQ